MRASILTKQLFLKVKNILPRIDDGIPIDFKTSNDDYKEEVSEMSNVSNNELCVKYYKSTTKVLQIQRERITQSLEGVSNVTNLVLLTAAAAIRLFAIWLLERCIIEPTLLISLRK